MLDLERQTAKQFSMNRKYFLLVLILILSLSIVNTYAQLNKYGTPVIENYSNQITGGTEQNWWITKDKFGLKFNIILNTVMPCQEPSPERPHMAQHGNIVRDKFH